MKLPDLKRFTGGSLQEVAKYLQVELREQLSAVSMTLRHLTFDDNFDQGRLYAPSTWRPELSAAGSMTFALSSQPRALHTKVGRLCTIWLDIVGTTGGSASTALKSSLPFKPDYSASANQNPIAAVVEDGGTVSGMGFVNTEGGLSVIRYDGANWGLGASRGFQLMGSYLVEG